jgi:hypothetical protein
MKKPIPVWTFVGFLALVSGARAQNLPGGKIDFMPSQSQLAVFATPPARVLPKGRRLRGTQPTPGVPKDKFFPLNPKAKPTPQRAQKFMLGQANAPVSVLEPRNVQAGKGLAPVTVLGPRNFQVGMGMAPVSASGPRSVPVSLGTAPSSFQGPVTSRFHSLYQDPQ